MAKVIHGVRQADGKVVFSGMSSGGAYVLQLDDYIVPGSPNVNVVIDSHSHIQSGATAPLPLLWEEGAKKTGGLIKYHFERSFTDTLGPIALGRAGKVQKLKTDEIAGILVDEMNAAYKESRLLEDKPYKSGMSEQAKDDDLLTAKQYLFAPVIIMPMDMDFAHIAGFPPENTRIYHEGKVEKLVSDPPATHSYALAVPSAPVKIEVDGVYCYERSDGTLPENKGKLFDVSHERPNHVWVHQRYKNQIDATKSAVKNNPWQIIPMFHYDPRRWCKNSGDDFDKQNWSSGPWDEPFKFIATQKNAGIFIGFKMYPPLGYKPFDKRLPNLEKFYARCEAEGIPILTHCSPGGMCTHEAKYYYQLDRVNLSKKPDRLVSVSYDPCTPLGYFYDNYVHPQNWRPVLMKFPKLKLCLAHFGGQEWDDDKGFGLASDWVEEINKMCNPAIIQGNGANGPVKFENVYTDLSCQDLENSSVRKNIAELFGKMKIDNNYKHLQNKLLFGVDWYLSILTGAPQYREFAEAFFDTMKECDEWQWYRSSLVNSAVFYGLDNQELLTKMYSGLSLAPANKLKLNEGFIKIKKIKEQVEILRKDMKNTRPSSKK